jgi:hypothetical protein
MKGDLLIFLRGEDLHQDARCGIVDGTARFTVLRGVERAGAGAVRPDGARCVSLLSWPPANHAEAARIRRSREEPFASHAACQSEDGLTFKTSGRVNRSLLKILARFFDRQISHVSLPSILQTAISASAKSGRH